MRAERACGIDVELISEWTEEERAVNHGRVTRVSNEFMESFQRQRRYSNTAKYPSSDWRVIGHNPGGREGSYVVSARWRVLS